MANGALQDLTPDALKARSNIMRTLKLMADYYCFPLWEASPGLYGEVDPATLPISRELVERLMKWQNKYDATLNRADPSSPRSVSNEEVLAFIQEKSDLFDALKSELGPEYEVVLK